MNRLPIRGRPARRLAAVLAAGALVAGTVGVSTSSAWADTLLTDTFEDGDANGWSRSGGSWSVVTDGSLAFRQSGSPAPAATPAP